MSLSVGVLVYLFLKSLNKKSLIDESDSEAEIPRGGDDTPRNFIFRNIMKHKEFKIAIMATFADYIISGAHDDILKLATSSKILAIAKESDGECANPVNRLNSAHNLED